MSAAIIDRWRAATSITAAWYIGAFDTDQRPGQRLRDKAMAVVNFDRCMMGRMEEVRQCHMNDIARNLGFKELNF